MKLDDVLYCVLSGMYAVSDEWFKSSYYFGKGFGLREETFMLLVPRFMYVCSVLQAADYYLKFTLPVPVPFHFVYTCPFSLYLYLSIFTLPLLVPFHFTSVCPIFLYIYLSLFTLPRATCPFSLYFCLSPFHFTSTCPLPSNLSCPRQNAPWQLLCLVLSLVS